jgi:hypothetical protein
LTEVQNLMNEDNLWEFCYGIVVENSLDES